MTNRRICTSHKHFNHEQALLDQTTTNIRYMYCGESNMTLWFILCKQTPDENTILSKTVQTVMYILMGCD